MNAGFTDGAREDYDSLLNWYAATSHSLANQFVDDYLEFLRKVQTQPRIYALVHRSPRGREIRVGQLSIFPILVHYEVLATRLVILSLTHAHRRSSPWRRRLP